MNVVGKIYAGILVERVRLVTEEMIGEEQDAFKNDRGCADQIFTLKQMSEKMREKKKSLYLAFRRPQSSPLHTLTLALGVLLQTPGLITRDYDLQKIWVAIRHVKPMLSLFRC